MLHKKSGIPPLPVYQSVHLNWREHPIVSLSVDWTKANWIRQERKVLTKLQGAHDQAHPLHRRLPIRICRPVGLHPPEATPVGQDPRNLAVADEHFHGPDPCQKRISGQLLEPFADVPLLFYPWPLPPFLRPHARRPKESPDL